MGRAATVLSCAGCGAVVPPDEPTPFRCPAVREGDDIDHVVHRTLGSEIEAFPAGDDTNPFVRYRHLFYSYHVGRRHGLSDDAFVSLVEELDARVVSVDGRGFRITPFDRHQALASGAGLEPPGAVWVKDETRNVSGSHKGRHLMGLLIWLEVADRAGLAALSGRRLAIASCGNAALAAAVLARAAGRPLDVFVPTWADPAIVRDLAGLGADVFVCTREEGEPGDPTYRRLREAVATGALPFTCQGPDDGLTIEGGLTLGYEIADGLHRASDRLDRVVIQVGGGALASAVIQGLQEAAALGIMDAMPTVDTVQTAGASPLARAYDLVVPRLLDRLENETGGVPFSAGRNELAAFIRKFSGEIAVESELTWVARHRSTFMWPWESEPRSVATGILDDETYDWMAVVRGMIATGGLPYVVSDELLVEANHVARATTSIDVDHTGSAGLAGLLEARRGGGAAGNERVAVLFTGRSRA